MLHEQHGNGSLSLCSKRFENECLSESFFNVYEMAVVVIVTLLFSFHQIIVSRLSNAVKSYIINRRISPELLRLGAEVKKLKEELTKISPTSEFSAYFKTERLLNKASEAYEAAVAEEKKDQPSEVTIEMAVKVVLQALGLALLHCVSGIYAFCIPSVAFWPLNFLLRFPSLSGADLCDGTEVLHTPVSMFVFIYCTIFTIRIFCF
ncbi:hypothetical protein DICVIV_06856 [Dictyocaulus viviparus]|uniref:Uncharacterized protein n=1 Tax=Dictyocaulus viviparus TaxID=29172 RepID=A0A0D8XT98_DICVI|nr:hypothetical protein DICVIV_06856 [Dictyocaulus viviparus]